MSNADERWEEIFMGSLKNKEIEGLKEKIQDLKKLNKKLKKRKRKN